MKQIGVCTWSLRPAGIDDLIAKVRSCGVHAVQLALDPIRRREWDESETIARLRDAGVAIVSGMMAMRGENYATLESIRQTGGVRSDADWPENLRAAADIAAIAQRMRIPLVTFHAGFLPHDRSDPLRAVMIGRLRAIADVFAEHGIEVALETGQETAATLCRVLDELDRANCGVNFDPANMILYGMGDPIEAFATLASRVRQVHIKDALPSPVAGVWGTEMPMGEGAVDWHALLGMIRTRTKGINVMIEREGGSHALQDIRAAHALIQKIVATN